ncbi:MAG: arginine--tRNA ligase [Crocinitomicaceae bacterium]|nr:arginine--tRNA ligase [Crocinitomicaceae bacterium]
MISILAIKNKLSLAVSSYFSLDPSQAAITIENTKKDFEGDLTIVVFSLSKYSKKSPEETAHALGSHLLKNLEFFYDFNVVKGFLNLSLKSNYWLKLFNTWIEEENYGFNNKSTGELYMVEYSSPNTNKPLHLGHLRNIFLGDSVVALLKAVGHQVVKTQIINDRGIHICKSMVAWEKYGDGETPLSSKIKGDHLVGKYYVEFDKVYKSEITNMINNGIDEKQAKSNAPILLEAQRMLVKWENGDKKVRNLWKKMNNWVYEGFNLTYKSLQVSFDKLYYESDTYQVGKQIVKKGAKDRIFYQKKDHSIWCDLSSENMDDKLLSRSDGTSVYMTQDIGTAVQRFKDFPKLSGVIYTVGNEQNHHFKVLFKILEKLNLSWAKNCYHLSYGMVELPDGKMKSREGNVVDADELLTSVISEARILTSQRGFLEELSEKEVKEICQKIGLSGIKYFLLKVDPKKKISFNSKETIDLTGHTGPFIQYTFVRIISLLNKLEDQKNMDYDIESVILSPKEIGVIKSISNFPFVLEQSAKQLAPYLLANYLYTLVKSYNSFYQDNPIIAEENVDQRKFRVQLSRLTSDIIKGGMKILGIQMPKRM